VIVVLTDEAKTDLERISDFIAVDNPLRAETFVGELLDRCLRLAEMPRAFPLVPRYEKTGIHRRPYENYLAFLSHCRDARGNFAHLERCPGLRIHSFPKRLTADSPAMIAPAFAPYPARS
jgi:toxin ParE1/3/4